MANGVAFNLAKSLGGKSSQNLKLPVSALYYDPKKDARNVAHLSDHVQNLANKIRVEGYLSDFPIKVRPDKSGNNFEIINGRNRYRAMCLIVESKDLGNWDGFAEVTPTRPDISESEFFFQTLQGNNDAQRPFTAIEEGFYFQQLYDNHSQTLDQIAKRIGKSITYVSDRLALVNLPKSEMKDEIEHFVNTGVMSPTAATEIAKLPEEKRVEAWKEIKKIHSENSQNNTLSSGKTSTKKGIRVKDVKKATSKKGATASPINSISIRTFKENRNICAKMFQATKSEIWGKALEVLDATWNNKVIDE